MDEVINSQEEIQVEDLYEKIEKLDQELIRQAEIIEKQKKVIEFFEKKVQKLIRESEKKEEYIKDINKVVSSLSETIEKIGIVKKNVDISKVSVESKNYLKGQFIRFEKEKAAIEVKVEGKSYFYPLSDYQCRYLPISGARVFIFKSENGKNLIFGFNLGVMIPLRRSLCGVIKFLSRAKKQVKIYIEDIGYVHFEVTDDFFSVHSVAIGDKVILKEVEVEGRSYFFIESDKQENITAREKILQLLQKV